MKTFTLILMLCFSLVSHSEDVSPGQIIWVEKSDPMPFNGFAVDRPQMRYFRQINEERKVAQEKVVKLEDLKAQHEAKIDYLEDEYTKINKAYKSEQRKSTWAKVLYFAGGVLVTGAAVYGASKLRN